jgi:hypothetical protein
MEVSILHCASNDSAGSANNMPGQGAAQARSDRHLISLETLVITDTPCLIPELK